MPPLNTPLTTVEQKDEIMNNFVLCSTIKHESCILTIQCAGL